jgi:hypothetical protein
MVLDRRRARIFPAAAAPREGDDRARPCLPRERFLANARESA